MRLQCGVMPVLKVGVGLLALACAALYAQGPGGGSGRPQQPRPVLLALDVDRDGTLSAAEIAAAPKVLPTLDADGDGQLSSLEYLPKQNDPNAVDPDALVARLMVLDKNGDGVLTADELPERLGGMMARLDANHDGRITPDEVRASATKQGGPAGRRLTGAGATRMDPVLNAIDADHDGVLSAAEIANAAAALRSLDRNGDGQLTPDELKMRQQTPADRAQHTLDEWDTNKDGKLSKAEAPDRMQEQFEKIDTNGDGFLDLAELTAYNAAQPAQGPRPNSEGKQ
ncbi:Ca2+-binding protein, EF-hand superfamily [Granulicella rosea]|uniref:Ca2+-binding protein, EF-hand superfamily n=1 Tax=Granulicella rosea TaxID=474952 RepID=A0A239KMF7_9BACT|nr:EF-hand domain-containing protein [Granulicella rosea]SNT19180.1 Ca2+-binding protein, EF-hand superfamily [Granulicella rosea]